MTTLYDANFYIENENVTKYSPKIIFDIVLSLIDVETICDVGGGVGLWMSQFIEIKGKDYNTDNVLCIDGDYVTDEQLMIPKKCFRPADLEKPLPISDKKYDLAMSLEVAEHLSKERADSFIDELTKISDTVLFSAAIIGQGGTNHINEQFMGYWIKKFEKNDYEPFDVIRPLIQNNNKVPFWYRQNILLFAKKGTPNHSILSNAKIEPLFNFVSEDNYKNVLNQKNDAVKEKQDLKSKLNDKEREKQDLKSKIECVKKEKEDLKSKLNDKERELNWITSGSLYRPYRWLKINIFSKLKF